jgi:DNA-binding transcriptional ArsR family regulator
MLEALREGPQTASTLARELAESTGATSYHLRALESAGLIKEDLDLRRGRERWWRDNRTFGLISTAPADDDEYLAAVAQLESVMVNRDEDALSRYTQSRNDFTPEWQETAFIGGWGLYATREEVEELSQFIVGWMRARRLPPEQRPPGSTYVHLTYRLLPQRPPGN